MDELTIVVVPRDRYSGVETCIQSLYEHTETPFELLIPDLGYSKSQLEKIHAVLRGKSGYKIIPMGITTPMAAFKKLLPNIESEYLFWLDNDSRVSPNWLPPLLDCARETDAAVVSPTILENAGFGTAEPLNHLTTNEVRVVNHENVSYLIEHKYELRDLPSTLGHERKATEMFELHGVLLRVNDLKAIDIPDMVIREHIDIALQLHRQGKKLVHEPKSTILFDNLGTRMHFQDIRYFNHRWSQELMEHAAEDFERRWGYRFYNEKHMYNWAARRRLYIVLRFLFVPSWLTDQIVRIYNKIFLKHWDPVEDPIANSYSLAESLSNGYSEIPTQIHYDKNSVSG